MSQAPVILPGSPLTGAAAAADINAAWAAQISLFSGTTAPTVGPGASSALVEGQDWLDTSKSVHVWKKWDGTQWCTFAAIDPVGHAAFPPLSWRNIIGDNGGLEVWQRGAGSSASFAVGASSTTYTADRWYYQNGANQASVIAAVAGLTSNSNLAAKITRNNGQTGTTFVVFAFPLDTDEIVRLRGKLVAISYVAKAGTNWSPASGALSVFLFAGTGAVGKRGTGAYTSETQVFGSVTNIAPGTQQSVGTAGAVIVAMPTNATQAEVTFAWTPVGTAGADDSITIDDVQLEVGGVSLFERVPFEKSLLGCKRHYAKTFPYGTAPAQNAGLAGSLGVNTQVATSDVSWNWQFPVSMRVNPSITTYNPANASADARNATLPGQVAITVDPNTALSPDRVFIETTATIAAQNSNIYLHVAADSGI